MSLKKLTVLAISVALVSACSGRDESPRRTEVKPPPAPTGNTKPTSSSPADLVSKDNQRREGKRQELVTTNPDISRVPMIRKPRLDDVVAVNLNAQKQNDSLQSLKLSIVIKVNNQMVSIKFVSDKKMSAEGSYQPLTILDKTQKLSAEARCLVSCSDVLVRVRRENLEEIAFVFKDSELTMIPGLEKDSHALRVQKSSRVLEVGYLVSDSLESLQKSMDSHKAVIEKMFSENSSSEDLRQASEMLPTIASEILVASNDVYELSRLAIRGGSVTLEQSAGDQKLAKISQSLTVVSALVKQESLSSELQREIDLLNNQVRPKIQLMTQLLSK